MIRNCPHCKKVIPTKEELGKEIGLDVRINKLSYDELVAIKEAVKKR